MKIMMAIEKSALHKGEYVAYSNGANRVRRTSMGWAVTIYGQYGNAERFEAKTLHELDKMITSR